MFKVARWRNEKIKVVFMLHFHATQVPISKSRLMISVVPVDVGQSTVRLGKASVQNGICKWENPVYESVKFSREAKTGKIQDKFYQFIVSTGSSKSGFFGEVFVNLADYVEATTPSTISIPIKSSFAGAILHVRIQNIQGADDQRELQRDGEENETLTMKTPNTSLRDQLRNSEFDGELNQDTSVFPDAEGRKSISNVMTLDSLFKQKDCTTHEETVSGENEEIDWSSEDDVVKFIENTKGGFDFPRERKQEPPKTLVEQLKREILALQRKSDVTDLELQSLRKQVVKETKRGQELSGKVVKLKAEREECRKESEKLRSQQKIGPNEAEEGINHTKGLNRALQSQLRATRDSNAELVLVVRELEEKLDMKEEELAKIFRKMQDAEKAEEIHKISKNELEDDEEISALQEKIKKLQNDLESRIKEERRLEEQIEQYAQDYEMAKKENNDLSSKFNQKQLELLKKERESTHNLRKVEELESQIARLENVIKRQAEEFSENTAIIIDYETQLNSLKFELGKQATEFEDELNVMSFENVGLEKRALRAEENLERKKEEIRELSEELASKFNENEEINVKAKDEARELRDHISMLEDRLQKVTWEFELARDECVNEVEMISSQLTEKEKELEQQLHSHKSECAELLKSRRQLEDRCNALSNENQTLRTEVERLTEENYYFTNQLEEKKILVDETKTAFEEITRARDRLERKYTSAVTEIKRSQEELKGKEDELAGMQSQLENLQAQQKESKTRLSDIKSDNENLRKQVIRQKEKIQKKDLEITHLEKFKDSSSKEILSLQDKVRLLKAIRPTGISPENGNKTEEKKHSTVKKSQQSAFLGKTLQNGSTKITAESRRETCTEKKTADSRTNDLLSEVMLLKDKNRSTEDELKELQEKYSDVSLKFAEVEGERQQLVMTIRNLRNGQKK